MSDAIPDDRGEVRNSNLHAPSQESLDTAEAVSDWYVEQRVARVKREWAEHAIAMRAVGGRLGESTISLPGKPRVRFTVEVLDD